jgi:hypothetical protein
VAAKDISMGGIAGTTLMLCEASGVGATLRLEDIPRPPDVPWATWLQAFPSYGFVLAARPGDGARLCAAFAAREIDAAVVGRVNEKPCVTLASGGEQATLWDLARTPLTGFGPRPRPEARP